MGYNRAVNVSKLVGGVVLIAVPCTWASLWLTDPPRLQAGIANGAYANRCCGEVVLKNGLMTVANQHLVYVIERDNGGPYILPERYVGASKQGFVIKFDAPALKLHINKSVRPSEIQLLDEDGEVYPFARATVR